MPSVLFVCRANQFRSPVAAACFLRALKQQGVGSGWVVESAGTWTKTGLPMPSIVLQVTRRLGLSGLARHLTRQLTAEILNQFDLVIVMEIGQKEAIVSEFPARRRSVYLLSETVDGIAYDVVDPAMPGVDPDRVADEINALISKGANQIMKLAQTLQAENHSS